MNTRNITILEVDYKHVALCEGGDDRGDDSGVRVEVGLKPNLHQADNVERLDFLFLCFLISPTGELTKQRKNLSRATFSG